MLRHIWPRHNEKLQQDVDFQGAYVRTQGGIPWVGWAATILPRLIFNGSVVRFDPASALGALLNMPKTLPFGTPYYLQFQRRK